MEKTPPLTFLRPMPVSEWKWQDVNSYLLVALIFSIPFSTSATGILSVAILAGWVLKGDFKGAWVQVRSSRIVLASLLFLGLHLVGLLWTSDVTHGLAVLQKQWKFLLIPVCMCCARKEHVNLYIGSLIWAMAISVIISYGIWLQLIPPISKGVAGNPVPVGTHVTYNVVLAVAIYLVARSLIFDGRSSIIRYGPYLLILAMMVVNMFITGGRSGQLMFFASIAVLCFQYFGRQFSKAAVASVAISLCILATAFSFSDLFRHRLSSAIRSQHLSVQERKAYAVGGLKIFFSHPLIGVGTGDLPSQFRIVQPNQRPGFYGGNPHNMYVMAMVRFGILGLASLLYIFYVQVRHALDSPTLVLRQVGLAIPLLFMVVNFGESYLSVHATSVLFAAFSSFLYKTM